MDNCVVYLNEVGTLVAFFRFNFAIEVMSS